MEEKMPPSKGLKIDQRRKKILEILIRDGQVRVSELSSKFGATPATIRSDLSALRENGYLERTSGGAVPRTGDFYHRVFRLQEPENSEIKKRIAAATADLIHDGETLFINSGTTTIFTAHELKRHRNLNIVTNSLLVAMELGELPSFRVILLGGRINTAYAFTYGTDILEQIRQFRADKTILSMDGIRADGLTTYHAEEAVVNRAMMERSGETIVVADQSKIGYESFSFVSKLTSVSCLVTNTPLEAGDALVELEKAGLRVIVVD
jgi:DeoR/GlpR family transcriptional regulator of sugar metabolism